LTDIRRVTAADLDLVAPLFDAYRQFYGCTPDLDLARRFLRERLDRGESIIFVAVINGNGVGFVQLYPMLTSIGAKRAWILNDLYVKADARRQGVGKALMDTARKMAEETGAAWMELATAKDNVTAQALYRRCGYERDEEYDRFQLKLS
jgi:ribosomal protein S18 acetylase RimI-like enzyme